MSMESELAKRARQEQIEAAKRMTPRQRLDAYIEHCRQVYRFYEAGRQVRDEAPRYGDLRK